jgi:hypothetical protein
MPSTTVIETLPIVKELPSQLITERIAISRPISGIKQKSMVNDRISIFKDLIELRRNQEPDKQPLDLKEF